MSFIKKHKHIGIGILVLGIIALITLIFLPQLLINRNLITIKESNFTVSDFNMYLYSGKYNLYGKDNTDIPKATLNSTVKGTEVLVKDYLKDKATAEIKIAGMIRLIAKENNISLSGGDYDKIDVEKQNFIKSIGGQKEFKKLLKKNNTTEKSYDLMLETDALYKKVFDSVYSDGKSKDLTAEEKESAQKEYYSTYYKIQQIVIAKINLSTGKKLNDIELNQKKELVNTLLTRARNGEDFTNLVKKYSDDSLENKDSYFVYFKSGDLLEELETATKEMLVGDISNVISTSNAFHIIKKYGLDNAKLDLIYSKVRENKLLEDISNLQKDVSIIYHNPYTNIKIK